MNLEEITILLKQLISSETGIDIDEISGDNTFVDLGLDSIRSVYLLDILERKLSMEINPYWFWEYPTVNKLSKQIFEAKANA